MHRKLVIALTLAIAAMTANAESARKPAYEAQGLTADFIFKFLVGEIAGQRGDLSLASAALLDLANSSKDARLAERATRAAIYGNQPQIAARAATLWVELDPESKEARQALTQLLMAAGKLTELRPHLQKLLADEDNPAGAFMYLVGMFSGSKDKTGVYQLVKELAKPYRDLPEAHFAVAHAAWNMGQDKPALAELQAADQLNPGWEPGAMLKAQILQRKSADDAMKFYREYLDTYPSSNEVRMAYARLLVNEKQLEPARLQLDTMIETTPDKAEIHVVVGLLCSQMEDLRGAEQHFQKALDLGFKEADQVKLYLGQIAERAKNPGSAQSWYEQVPGSSQHHLDAQLRLAALEAQQGDLGKARSRLQNLTDLTQEQRVIATQAEAGLLVKAKREQEAFDLLRVAIENLPNSPDLIYDFAMVAERVEQFEVMEHELRKLILLKPEMAHAYNALGYSLADRNERLDEAQKLIEKALTMSPADYFILDSMGWLKYRRGQLVQALDYLKRAYAARADPEVAAHLGEVLWQQGKREEALKTWEEALQAHPENEVLVNTTKKFHQ